MLSWGLRSTLIIKAGLYRQWILQALNFRVLLFFLDYFVNQRLFVTFLNFTNARQILLLFFFENLIPNVVVILLFCKILLLWFVQSDLVVGTRIVFIFRWFWVILVARLMHYFLKCSLLRMLFKLAQKLLLRLFDLCSLNFVSLVFFLYFPVIIVLLLF